MDSEILFEITEFPIFTSKEYVVNISHTKYGSTLNWNRNIGTDVDKAEFYYDSIELVCAGDEYWPWPIKKLLQVMQNKLDSRDIDEVADVIEQMYDIKQYEPHSNVGLFKSAIEDRKGRRK